MLVLEIAGYTKKLLKKEKQNSAVVFCNTPNFELFKKQKSMLSIPLFIKKVPPFNLGRKSLTNAIHRLGH